MLQFCCCALLWVIEKLGLWGGFLISLIVPCGCVVWCDFSWLSVVQCCKQLHVLSSHSYDLICPPKCTVLGYCYVYKMWMVGCV